MINEFAADNTLILDPAGEAEDWIELYNNLAQPVDLGGMYLSDTPSAPTKWQFPAGTSIAAHGYLIVWADEDLTQEGLHATFKLSASGESVVFSSTPTVVLDTVTFGAADGQPDHGPRAERHGPVRPGRADLRRSQRVRRTCWPRATWWSTSSWPTTPCSSIRRARPRTGSSCTTTPPATSTSAACTSRTAPRSPPKWQFPAGTVIPAGGYLLVWADEDLAQPGLHAAFKLSSTSGEAIVLSNPDLSVVDDVTFGAQETDVAMARIPNGTGAFVLTTTPTPGASNQGPDRRRRGRSHAPAALAQLPQPAARQHDHRLQSAAARRRPAARSTT